MNIEITKLGRRVKVVFADREPIYTDSANFTASYNNNNDTVEITADQTTRAAVVANDELIIEGVTVSDETTFDQQIALVFPNEGGGSGPGETPNLQAVTDVGNITTKSIYLSNDGEAVLMALQWDDELTEGLIALVKRTLIEGGGYIEHGKAIFKVSNLSEGIKDIILQVPNKPEGEYTLATLDDIQRFGKEDNTDTEDRIFESTAAFNEEYVVNKAEDAVSKLNVNKQGEDFEVILVNRDSVGDVTSEAGVRVYNDIDGDGKAGVFIGASDNIYLKKSTGSIDAYSQSGLTASSEDSKLLMMDNNGKVKWLAASPLDYSTDEARTGGTWIDGKPIYRKVLTLSDGWDVNTQPTFTRYEIDGLDTDWEKVIGAKVMAENAAGQILFSDSHRAAALCGIKVNNYFDGTFFIQLLLSDDSGTTPYVPTSLSLTLEYTKTTD
jgi:hypothetical protein